MKKLSMVFVGVVLCVVGVVLLVGCADSAKSHDDTRNYTVDRGHVDVLAMPNDFGNVANKCDAYGHRVFITTNTDSPSNLFVIDDRSCTK